MTQTAPKTVKWTRTLELTERQEDVLVKMALHYLKTNDCNQVAKNDLDSLVDMICEPSPFDYNVEEV